MPKVIGIKFKKSPKMYYFEAGDYEYQLGESIVVETSRGIEMGEVSMLVKEIAEEKVVSPLKPIMRKATEEDLAKYAKLNSKREEVIKICDEKIQKAKLDMKLVDAEYTFDGSKLIVYFTSEGRVDFRDLVRELASAFRVRIELRQIGARDECKMLGGIAPCGRACCCSDHISEYAHVSIKMAKNQNLSLNPGKISGLCGRLMCCLQYENSNYVEVNKRMPKIGSEVEFEGKKGIVTGLNQLKETVRVKSDSGKDGSYEFNDVPLANLKFKSRGSAADDLNKDEKLDEELKSLID